MRRQTKAGDEKCLKNNQFALGLGNLLRPRDTPNPAATVPERSSKDASAVGVVAADEDEDDMATYRRWRRAVCFTRTSSPTNRSKEGRRASEQFEKGRLGFSRRAER
jgi:hypothetical protein